MGIFKEYDWVGVFIVTLTLVLMWGCDHRITEPALEKQEIEINKFFSYNPDSIGGALEMAIDTLRKIQSKNPFVKEFINEKGLPVWRAHSSLTQQGQRIFLVPVRATRQQKVTGIAVIAIKKHHPSYSWMPRGAAFKDSDLPNKKQLERFMLMFEKIIFGEMQTADANIVLKIRRQNVSMEENVAAEWVEVEICVTWHYANQPGGGISCTTDVVWVERAGDGGDSGGGGNSGGGTDEECTQNGGPFEPCFSEPGGGSDPIPPCSTATPPDYCTVDITIEGSFANNPCLSSVYETAGKAEAYNDILNNFDDDFSVADLYLSVGDTPGYSNAIAVTHNPTNYYIEIRFDPDNLDFPKLGIAAAFIHELIHAEMFRKLLSAAQQGKIPWSESFIKSIRNDFPGLYDYYMRYYYDMPNGIPPGEPQHQMMATHYRDVIEQALRQFDGSFSNEVYEALAWNGLQGTVAWNRSDTTSTIQTLRQFRVNHSSCN